MMNPNYQRALTRSDLSQWLVHFVRSASLISPDQVGTASELLDSIFRENFIRPSSQEYVTHYSPEGAACFYDAPPSVWPEIAQTNPNSRPPVGIICHKTPVWSLGGRPVIYTDRSDPSAWPESDRFRLVHTNLSRFPPVDWTHEREWRVRGGLCLNQPQINYTWWWPIVPDVQWCNYLFQKYLWIHSIYVISRNQVVTRSSV